MVLFPIFSCISEHTAGCAQALEPQGSCSPLTCAVQDGDVVSGELVLAAHTDEQGAASPAGTGTQDSLSSWGHSHPQVLPPSSSSAAPGHR